ncbi:MAG: chitobiase/beta-hexosaminidase C-terminal domain-containing protein [Oscillospiraceae bacterium]|nr:chitobiase/beta-hexosaminidase C-terminal domain-containing protein [Oscillospiraceae bacterium]
MRNKSLPAAVLCGVCALCGWQQLPSGAVSLSDETPVYAAAENVADSSLPEMYDMRKSGLTTKVQRQGSTSICWSFAAIAALESQAVPRVPDIELSAWSMAFYAFSPAFGYDKDENEPFSSAGGVNVAAPMLTSWLAPVPLADFPSAALKGDEADVTAEELRSRTVWHTTDIDIFMNDPNMKFDRNMQQSVKQSVYDGKAVAMIYYNDSKGYSSDNRSFYNPDFNRASALAQNYHSVVIVGWDDDYSAELFLRKPAADGAFLCKNSWGTGWGDNGYFWISYEDPSFSQFYSITAEPAQRHTKQYQYDTYGFCRSIAMDSEDTSAYMANCFTAEEDTVMTAVMFVTALAEEDYTITVCKEVRDASDPVSGTAAGSVSGHQKNIGYHTVDLEQPVFLSKGERFSIIVKLSGSAGQHIPCEAYARFTTEKPDGTVYIDSETLFPKKLIEQDFHKGESFVSPDGKSWTDMYSYDTIDNDLPAKVQGDKRHVYGKLGNVCVRGLMQEVGRVQFSECCEEVTEGTKISLTCPGADTILYSTDGTHYEPYTEPIPITEKTSLSARAVLNGKEYPSVTRNYRIATARLTNLLRLDTNSYLNIEQLTEDCFTSVCKRTDAELRLLPVSTADIYAGRTMFSSYTPMWVSEGNVIYLQTKEEGKRDGLYVIYLTDIIKGNVNLDKAVNASDATEILIYAAKQGTGGIDNAKDAAWLDRADFNEDGLVNASDASAILIYAARRGTGRTE